MRVENINVAFGDKKVLQNFSLVFPKGKITCVLGPSGCGKTTLLNVLSDSVPYTGTVYDRPDKVGFVFQDPTLFSHLTVAGNIDFVLRREIKDKNKRIVIIDDILKKVGLSEEKDSFPDTLSGGMAQRVSLARAFAYDSGLLLLDEPFKGLDISLKKKIIEVFVTLYLSSSPTTVFVTHDVDEAVLLGQKIIVMNEQGNVVYDSEIDSPVGERDATEFATLRKNIYESIE